ncbi:ATP-binding protein [Yinghuangia soli]|uniref:DNA topoisomerase (ATP-hydrolyzing) n=1 Tax=Yinghuangia soli TaxID=2908204 RepID=A0AA41Q924_9ACTN|nr:ATP-binding protein [Yinghuangia soli]MCF2533838.1 ATP-binding protein [Yinghuangia soli]
MDATDGRLGRGIVNDDKPQYDASSINVLSGLEAVRKRPGMYIGSTDERGLHNMLFEVAARALNHVVAGRAGQVEIVLLPAGGVRVADDGPGLAASTIRGADGPDLESEMTRFLTGSTPRRREFVSDFGFGVAVANALSHRMTVEVRRDGTRWVQEYARGVALTPVTKAGAASGTGTTMAFWPDADIFTTTAYSFAALADRFRELALLNATLDITLTDARDSGEPASVRFRYPGGVRDFVAVLDGEAREQPGGDPNIVGVEQEVPSIEGSVEVALRWRASGEPRIRSFANSEPTPGGGTHEVGFRDGVVAAVAAHARRRQPRPNDDGHTGIDATRVFEGLTAVVSVKLDEPVHEGCTRGRLGNPPVHAAVARVVREHLCRWFDAHPDEAAVILERTAEPT